VNVPRTAAATATWTSIGGGGEDADGFGVEVGVEVEDADEDGDEDGVEDA
jgi:hypothetical protein